MRTIIHSHNLLFLCCESLDHLSRLSDVSHRSNACEMKTSPYTYFLSNTTVPETVPNNVIYFVIGLDYRKRFYKGMMVKVLESIGETVKKSDFVEEHDDEMKCFGYPTYKVKQKKSREGLVLAQRYFYNLGYRPHTQDPFVQIYDLWRMRSLYLIVIEGKVVSKLHHLHEHIFFYNETDNILTVQKCNNEIKGYPPEALRVMDISVERPHMAVTVYGVDDDGEYDSNFCAMYTLNPNAAGMNNKKKTRGSKSSITSSSSVVSNDNKNDDDDHIEDDEEEKK